MSKLPDMVSWSSDGRWTTFGAQAEPTKHYIQRVSKAWTNCVCQGRKLYKKIESYVILRHLEQTMLKPSLEDYRNMPESLQHGYQKDYFSRTSLHDP